MSRTQELKREVKKILRRHCENVFYEEASTSRTYPYIVFEIRELSFDSGMALCRMEVNVIDRGDNSESIESACDGIQNDFDRAHAMTARIQFSAYRLDRQIVREEDKKILRRRMNFEIHLYERRNGNG